MRDIQVPGNTPRRPIENSRISMPAEQARRFVAPPNVRNFYPPKKNGNKKYLSIGLFVSLFLISIIFFLATYVFDGATITIKPEKRDVSISETFTVSEMDRKDLLLQKDLPLAQDVTIGKKISKNVVAKATGSITIYNSFSTDPQKFIKGTRFSTTDGKIFRIDNNVTVPGKTADGPGSISATVTADADGVDYNIGPTKFTVPGLKGSTKYNSFSAESTTTMSGGASGVVNAVAEADVTKAKDDLKNKLIAALQTQLSTNIPDGFAFNPDMLITVLGKMTKIKEDDETATYEETATGSTLYFKKDDIINRIFENQYTNDTTKPTVKVADTSNFTISVLDPQDALNSTGQVKMVVTGSASATFYPDKQAIIEYYAGRPVSDFNDIAKKFQFIDNASRVMRPFWTSYFPSNISKIKVDISE